MKLHSLTGRSQTGYTTWGCAWRQGECAGDAGYLLTGSNGLPVPMQSRITAYWPDGSVKWSAHTADCSLLGEKFEVTVCPPEKETSATGAITAEKTESGLELNASRLRVSVPFDNSRLFSRVSWDGEDRLLDARPVLLLEEPSAHGSCRVKTERPYRAVITETVLEEHGALQAIIRYTGCHEAENGERKIPFILRMQLNLESNELHFTHTFLYDGDEGQDFLKGLGLRFLSPLKGPLYNRHIKFTLDHGVFHETPAQLLSWRPRIPQELYAAQLRGEKLTPAGEQALPVNKVLQDMPFWSEYDLCQDSPNHFSVKKKLADDNCCHIDCVHGRRTAGGASFGSESGSVLVCLEDFWETCPSGYTVRGLDTDMAEATLWLWSPGAEAMDFRHYANRGYNQVCYEGYDYKGATPYGIASTSRYTVRLSPSLIPTDGELEDFAGRVRRPAQYVGTPEYYHSLRAFGYWSLPRQDTETEVWLENQLKLAFDFYHQEVDQRNWYGLFNYGDFMHTYDRERHTWRYDIGGYAWDNTELVPTLWLWYYFLRTGREEVFTLAERLTRHTSEVDVYHMGKYRGLGSRHNVRHWGCPCKEARIAMAAHHRFYYYLTGDRRLEDIFDELKDNELTFLNRDPLGDFYDKEAMVYPSHARSGPDWSSLCANWMTQWERTMDTTYRDKIMTGVEDIKRAPLQLVSGPDFEFNPSDAHLRYIGERVTGGCHLQVCMGSPQVWLEMADLLGDEEWTRMLADYGRFYYLPPEQQREESGGLIGDREFSLPFFAAVLGAYAAACHQSTQEAELTWKHLLHAAIAGGNHQGFQPTLVENQGNQALLAEIPWISTNFTAQWCLNVIGALDFIRKWLPETLAEADALTADMPEGSFRKA